MTTKSKWEDSFPRQKFIMATSSADLKDLQTFGVARVKELMRVKDNIIHDKKAEICKLREENDILLEVIRMMVRGINKMSSPSYGPFEEFK